MSIRKNKGVILLASALTLGLMCGLVVSCNNTHVNEDDPWKDFVEDESITGLEVKNIEELQATWKPGEADRTMSISVTPEGNITSLIQQKKVMAVSSDPSVVYVLGNKLQALKSGESTITVRAGKQKIEFKITIETVKEYKPGDEETLANIMELPQNYTMYYKTEGVILSWQKGSDGQSFGNFYVATEWDKNAANILVYGATGLESTAAADENGTPVLSEKDGTYTFTNPKDWLTNEKTKDLKIGDKISFYCLRLDYNSTKELYAWNVNFVEHKDFPATPEPDSVAVDSLSEVLAADAGVVANRAYTGKAKVSYIKSDYVYGNLKVTDLDGANETTVYGSTASVDAISWDGVTEKYTYSNKKDFTTNEETKKLAVGDIITYRAIRSDYNGAKQISIDSLKRVIEEDPNPVTGMVISNQDDLTSDWKLGEADRSIEFEFTGAKVNVADAIEKGLLKIESSDTKVVSVSGSSLHTEGLGEATITISYTNEESKGGKSFSKSFEVKVIENDSEQAAETKSVKEFLDEEVELDANNSIVAAKKAYFVSGTISRWNGDEADKFGAFYLKDATTDDEVLIYGSTANNSALTFKDGKWSFTKKNDFLTNSWTSNLAIGDSVSLLLIRGDYEGTKEGFGIFVYKNAGQPEDRVAATSATLAEILADTNVNCAYKLYETEATILGFGKEVGSLTETNTTDTYGNMFVTDGENNVYSYGATASTKINWYKGKYSLNNPKDFLTNEVTKDLKKGDKIKFVCCKSIYNGSVQISIDSLIKVA